MSENENTREFFDTYAQALLDRDPKAIANLYAVPALIVAPEHSLPVSDPAQTEEFFTAAFGQYEGVTHVRPQVEVIVRSGHSVWADVTWFHDGTAAERFVYQLIRSGHTWKIVVLTPMET